MWSPRCKRLVRAIFSLGLDTRRCWPSQVKPKHPVALAVTAALVPLAGSSAAGTLNLLVTRRSELEGIAIRAGLVVAAIASVILAVAKLV